MSPALIATGIFGFQLSLTGAVVGFTPASSVLRPGTLLLIASCPYFQFPYLEDIHYAPLRGALGAACIYTVIIYIDAVLLNKFTYDAGGPTSAAGGLTPTGPNRFNADSKDFGTLEGALRRFQFGLSISTQGRFPATTWSVKNIPPFSRSEPNYVPGKARFQLQTSLKVIIGFTLLALLGFAPKPRNSLTVYASEKVALLTRLDSISKQELTTRVGSVLGYWTVQYIIHVTVHGLFAVVAVTLGASEVKAWPPVFGSVQDAYSIRRYWGNFYHQLIRRGCSSIAHFATYTILGLKKGGLIGRYIFIVFVFFVSGVFHMLCDITQGIPVSESGAMKFFVMQSFGIMFEDTFLWVIQHYLGEKLHKYSWVSRTAGYIWVTAWLVWSSPIWLYPTMRRNKGDPLIPLPNYVHTHARDVWLNISSGYNNRISDADVITVVFILLSALLAVILLLAGTAAILQPTTLAQNTGLYLTIPPTTNGKRKTEDKDANPSVRGQQVIKAWVIMFGVRELALGLALSVLLYMGDLRPAAIVVMVMWVVAIGETYVLAKYGEGSIKKVVLPSLLLLWVAPVYLLKSSTT